MKSNMFWYTIFMSIQRLCYYYYFFLFFGGGGGSITETLPGVGVQGEKKIWGTREQVPSSLPGRASSVVCKVLISA